MLVKVNTSLAGADFSYNFGAEVDVEEFSAKVGNGWESLCDPIDTAEIRSAPEVAPAPVVGAEPAAAEEPKRGRRR